MSILVTGGAGYIGSATVELLISHGQSVVVVDNLSRGHRAVVPDKVPFYQGNVGDRGLVRRVTDEHQIDSCIHFAALAYVGESVAEPARYFENNVAQCIALLEALTNAGVKRFVFSSTCATYGEPQRIPIDEDHPQHPANPYGWSKFMIERVLESYDQAYDLRFAALRYFNAAGATASCGEDHDPETHLIPNVLRAADGELEYVSVFGNDYPTGDGTAIRDYIHVTDLASAHLAALDYLETTNESLAVNLGTGRGNSVLEVIEAACRVTGQSIEVKIEPRRSGDPSHLVASNEKANKLLGWVPQFTDLDSIIRSAYEWRKTHPQGHPKT